MAFFCPGSASAVKSGKGGKKNGKGKMSKTGPFPLDGSEKYPLRIHTDPHPSMVILQEFLPRNHRELHVFRGDVVELLGGERDWVYVRMVSGEKGFIPRSHGMIVSPDETGSRNNVEVTSAYDGRSHSTPVAPYSASPEEMRTVSSSGIVMDRLKGSHHSPIRNMSMFSSNSNGSISDGPLRRDKGKNVSGEGFGSKGCDLREDSPTYQNGGICGTSESDLLHYRLRPLPSLPRESPTDIRPFEGDSLYHTILRDTSMSPEPQTGPDRNDTAPHYDPHAFKGASPQNPLVLNSVTRRRHGSLNDSKLKKIMSEAGSGGLMMYRTSSDGPKTFNQISIRNIQADHKSPSPECQLDISKFRKVVWGVYEVVQGFLGMDENEISISEGERVSLLNQDDPNWFWVVKMGNAEEGFVPKTCLREHLSLAPEAEYDQIIPRTKSSPVPSRALSHNSRSKSLPRNAGMKCISSSSLEDRKKVGSLTRNLKLTRNSSPAAPVFLDWSHGHHMNPDQGLPGEIFIEQSGNPLPHEHPLHHTKKKGIPQDKYKRHSTDDNLLNRVSNLGLANKSEDSGILMADYDDMGTLV